MFDSKWRGQHVTDSAKKILEQIPDRAAERGLNVVDPSYIVMMTLWSLLLWERKVGRVALERAGIDIYDLARALDGLLEEKEAGNPVAVNQQGACVLVKTGEPYHYWDFEALLEPLLRQAEHEALALGHNYVGSEHLVLAIIRLADPLLTELLQKHAVVYDRVKEAILELLHS